MTFLPFGVLLGWTMGQGLVFFSAIDILRPQTKDTSNEKGSTRSCSCLLRSRDARLQEVFDLQSHR